MQSKLVNAGVVERLEPPGEFVVRIDQPTGKAWSQELDYPRATMLAALFRGQLPTEIYRAAEVRPQILADVAAGRLKAGLINLTFGGCPCPTCEAAGKCQTLHIGVAHPPGELGFTPESFAGKEPSTEEPNQAGELTVVGGFPLLDQEPTGGWNVPQETPPQAVELDLAAAEAQLDARDQRRACAAPTWWQHLVAAFGRWLLARPRLRVVSAEEVR